MATPELETVLSTVIEPPNSNYAYSGLTVILDKASRFDKSGLLQGLAGGYFDSSLVAGGNPRIHRASVEVRTLASVNEPLRPDTKALLLMGEGTLPRFIRDVSLDEQRGSPFYSNGIPCIATYSPQDSYDRRDYFSGEDDEGEDTKDTTTDDKTTHGKTQRRNWRFWMRQDIKKCVRIASGSVRGHRVPKIHLWPQLDTVENILLTAKGVNLYFDNETDRHFQMTCFGFSVDEGANIYVVPMLQTHQQPQTYYYGQETHRLIRALAVALRDNTVVIHNAMFDLFVLAWRYHVPVVGRVFDTMLAHNRCYIEVEKSLGHIISLYTYLPYHKNEGIFEPHNLAQTQQLYEYNAKDVFALTQCKPMIDAEAQRLGAVESVEQVNRMIVPYLTMTLQGIRLDTTKIASIVDHHTRWNEQIKRVLNIVTGKDDINPNSWQQVSKYLYEDLRIKKPAKDPTAEKTLLQILLKNDVPAIHAILKFRGNQKRISKASLKSKKGNPRYYFGLHLTTNNAPRLTTSWRLGKTITMRLGSSKLFHWGDNCLLPTSEVLTKQGWKEIQHIQPADETMQWDADSGELTWCPASLFIKPYCGPMVEASSFYHKHSYTPDHRIPWYGTKGAFKLKTAIDASQTPTSWRLPVGGTFNGGHKSLPEIRIAAMIQADGCIEHGGIRFEFLRGDKKHRFETLMKKFNIAYTTQTSSKALCSRYYIPCSEAKRFISLLGADKQWGPWLLSYDKTTLLALMDELKHWDAMKRGRSFQYYTNSKNNAEWIATVAHLTGLSASLNWGENHGTEKGLWTVNIKPRDKILCERKHFKQTDYHGYVYCLMTQTGFFITRQFGQIVITGNCQNWEKELRKVIVPDPGKVFVQADQSGAEALIVAYLCKKGQFRDLFLCNVNPHCYFALHLFTPQFEAELGYKLTDFVRMPVAMLAKQPQWNEIAKCIKSSDDWPADKRYYFIAKQGNHSLNYDAKPRAFRLNTLLKSEGSVAMTLDIAEQVVLTRLRLFPEIPSWHTDIVNEAKRTNILRNLFGHPRVVTSFIDESNYKELYAFKPQSTVGQITNFGVIELQERLEAGDKVLTDAGMDLMQQNHDSILVQCYPEYKEIVGRELQKHLSRDLVSPRGEKFQMKCEVGCGDNWGEIKEMKL